jgi:hypothetical protein
LLAPPGFGGPPGMGPPPGMGKRSQERPTVPPPRRAARGDGWGVCTCVGVVGGYSLGGIGSIVTCGSKFRLVFVCLCQARRRGWAAPRRAWDRPQVWAWAGDSDDLRSSTYRRGRFEMAELFFVHCTSVYTHDTNEDAFFCEICLVRSASSLLP